MGISLDADQHRRMLDHLRGDVRVAVERYDEGKLWPDEAANRSEEIALAILEAVACGGPVHLQEQPVERPGGT